MLEGQGTTPIYSRTFSGMGSINATVDAFINRPDIVVLTSKDTQNTIVGTEYFLWGNMPPIIKSGTNNNCTLYYRGATLEEWLAAFPIWLAGEVRRINKKSKSFWFGTTIGLEYDKRYCDELIITKDSGKYTITKHHEESMYGYNDSLWFTEKCLKWLGIPNVKYRSKDITERDEKRHCVSEDVVTFDISQWEFTPTRLRYTGDVRSESTDNPRRFLDTLNLVA